jgi:hypothetical protein
LNPNFTATLADALVLPGIVFTATELFPEQPIFRALPVGGVNKHRVMIAFDLLERIAERLQKILVGVQDLAIHAEFNDCLHSVDGIDHANHASIGRTATETLEGRLCNREHHDLL